MRCPECSTAIEVRHTRFSPFKCPTCSCQLCVPDRYLVKGWLVGAVAAFLVCYLAGVDGAALLICVALLSFVTGPVVTILGFLTIPPTIERYFRPGSLGLKL